MTEAERLGIVLDWLTDTLAELDNVPSAGRIPASEFLRMQRHYLNDALLALAAQDTPPADENGGSGG